MKRILSQSNGVTETFHSTDSGFVIQTTQDVEPILKNNERLRKEAGAGWKGNWHHYASIPMTLVVEWRKELGGDDPLAPHNRKWLNNKLNSNEFLKLRTKEGKL